MTGEFIVTGSIWVNEGDSTAWFTKLHTPFVMQTCGQPPTMRIVGLRPTTE